MHDVNLWYTLAGTVENYWQMWDIMFGQFETKDVQPFKDFERQYLEAKKWKYSKLQSDMHLRSGFVEKLVLQQKRVKLKNLNAAGGKSHGVTIIKSRPSELINEKKI